ncbi:hypothetical protein U91I_01017 [alpha proteobacterium U9-1i]|nr:hypothetical protein U91I_01017 [alpha proteobacterium U9-1i]
MKNVPARFGEASFSCLQCGALAQQEWFGLRAAKRAQADEHRLEPETFERFESDDGDYPPGIFPAPAVRQISGEGLSYVGSVALSRCFSCQQLSVWVRRLPAWPPVEKTHHANPDLPSEALRDFNEADSIFQASPRGAAALLRLAIQRLCQVVEPDARDLNDAIGRMNKRGLRADIQQALDIVRVVGNNAVHPGQLDLKDDAATASVLFELVNFIADAMITQPKKIAGMYKDLPAAALAGIAKRDGTTGS